VGAEDPTRHFDTSKPELTSPTAKITVDRIRNYYGKTYNNKKQL
jgi:hypothetical protein